MAETLRHGSKGDEVTALQTKLGRLGFDIKADGIFGPATKNAVEELQQAFGYDVDGVVGKGTHGLIDKQAEHGWNISAPGALKRALEAQGKQTDKGSLAGADLSQNLKRGSQGSAVMYLQRRLASFGYAIKPSGEYDELTDKTVRELQQAFGYTVDGVVGPGTHKLINAQIGHGWSTDAKKGEAQKQGEKTASTVPDKKPMPNKGGTKG